MRARHPHRLGAASRGFAMFVALLLLSMVSVALVCTAQLVREDARRTSDERIEAQLRTLILSAMTDARVRLDKVGALDRNGTIAVPAELKEATLTTEAHQNGEQWAVRIAAKIEGIEADEEVTFARDERGWRVLNAKVDDLSVRRRAPR